MKNYTYGWKLEAMGYYGELSIDKYTKSMKEMKDYIDLLSNVIVKAKCGWDGVEYKVMKHISGDISEYMVLCVGGHGERYIPISGNSKGCNFSVLGENLW